VGRQVGEGGPVMSMTKRLLMTLLSGVIPAQEFLWQVQSTGTEQYSYVSLSFGDLNHDGCDDVLAISVLLAPGYFVRILSGADGSVLYQHQVFPYIDALVGVGDFDHDGYPDFAVLPHGQPIEVWSPHLDQMLMQEQGAVAGNGTVMAGNVDLNG